MRRTKGLSARVLPKAFLTQLAGRAYVQSAEVKDPRTGGRPRTPSSSRIGVRGIGNRIRASAATTTLTVGLGIAALGLGGLGLGVVLGLSGGSAPASPSYPSPPASVCGDTSLLSGPSSAPAGAVVLAAGDNSAQTASDQMAANTTYWFAPGVHTFGTGQFGQLDPQNGDTFIGAPGATLNGQGDNDSAFDDTSSGVTIEYLTIENFESPEGQMVVNHDGGSNWTVEYNTIENNDGAGVGLGTNSVTSHNCLTNNSEYGFSSFGGSSNVTLTNNEISDNDSGGAYDQPGGGGVQCGCSGGGKFWDTENATITGNYVHDNGNVGIWADTDNAGLDISNNYISNNAAEGIIYEISYNALISDNMLVGNAIKDGPALAGFPDSAIYISESGGDSRVSSSYSGTFTVTGNVLDNNWGGIVLWENANRFCGDGSDQYCTLVDPSVATMTSCPAHLAESSPTDYTDTCRWKTQNVEVTDNTFSFSPAAIGSDCTAANFCGYNGLFSNYGSTAPYRGPFVPNNISNNQNNHFADNTYTGPWEFAYFNQGDIATPAQWQAGFSNVQGTGDNFPAQDAGSTFSS